MKFILKTDSIPFGIVTDDWVAADNNKTGKTYIRINKALYEIDKESFELLYFMYANELFRDNMTMVLDKGHVSIWEA